MHETSILLALLMAFTSLGGEAEGLNEPSLEMERYLTTNEITLGCLNVSNGAFISSAVFFLNDSVIYDMTAPATVDASRLIPRIVPNSRDMVVFLISRKAEGFFSCGRRIGSISFIRSESKKIVALPSATSPLLPITLFFAKVGSTASIDCPNKPGALVSQYYGIWQNSNNSQLIQEIPKPTGAFIRLFTPNPRYSIHRNSFSLQIERVALSDSKATYQCELGVESPQAPQDRFTFGRSVNLELLVYEPPTITTRPKSQVVSLSRSPRVVSFLCEAVGHLPPIIAWRHKGVNVSATDSKYLTTSETFGSSGGELGTRSMLRILALEVLDGGSVECVADTAPSEATSQFQLPGDTSESFLEVLGVFDTLDVFVTTSSDVIFSLSYPVPFMVPVRLVLKYFEVGGESNRSLVVQPSTSYVNTSRINHIAFKQQVPYDHFQVEVAVAYKSVTGPGKNNMLTYDKTSPTCEEVAPLALVLPSTFTTLILIVLAIVVLICVRLCYLHLKAKRFPHALEQFKKLICSNASEKDKASFMQLIQSYYIKNYQPIKCQLHHQQFRRHHSTPKDMGSNLETKQLGCVQYSHVPQENCPENSCSPALGNDEVDSAAAHSKKRPSNLYSNDSSSHAVTDVVRLDVFLDRPPDMTDFGGMFDSSVHQSQSYMYTEQYDVKDSDSTKNSSFPMKQFQNVEHSTTKKKEPAVRLKSSGENRSELGVRIEDEKENELAKETAKALKLMCSCLKDPEIQKYFQTSVQ